MDIRGRATTICPCGCNVWNLKTIFEEETGEIDMYFLDMECALCGTLATAPTPEVDLSVVDDNSCCAITNLETTTLLLTHDCSTN
jgi:hypothetical protein